MNILVLFRNEFPVKPTTFHLKRWLALAVSLLAVALNVNAETIYGVNIQLNELVSFNSATPGTLLSAHGISGLGGGEHICGIVWVTGTLYGLGDGNHLYTINTNTAAATQVGSGQFNTLLNGVYFGFSSTANSLLAVCSDLGQNMLVNPVTAATTSSPNYTGATLSTMAYSSATRTFFGVSVSTEDLYSMNPTTGAVSLIGPTGINFQDAISLTVSPNTGAAYLSATVNGQAEFFTVNLATGAATLVGDVGVPGTLTSGLNSIAVVQ